MSNYSEKALDLLDMYHGSKHYDFCDDSRQRRHDMEKFNKAAEGLRALSLDPEDPEFRKASKERQDAREAQRERELNAPVVPYLELSTNDLKAHQQFAALQKRYGTELELYRDAQRCLCARAKHTVNGTNAVYGWRMAAIDFIRLSVEF